MSETKTPIAKRPQDEKRMTLRALFDQQKPELAKLLPRGMSADRLYRLALTECTKNPKLLECTMESWALALQTCAAQGLYPDSGMGYMYLIPSNNSKKVGNEWKKFMEVRAQRGYQGDMRLWRNTGEIADIWAEVVYQKDTFVVKKGTERSIVHEPFAGEEDPGPLLACYAVAQFKDGTKAWVNLTKREVLRHKASAMDADNDKSPWKLHEAEMWKKTAIHVLSKWMPKESEKSEAAAVAIEKDAPPSAGQIIDTVALESVSLPAAPEGPRSALDRIADSAGECGHPKIAEHLKTAEKPTVCPDCGSEVAPERAPGAEG